MLNREPDPDPVGPIAARVRSGLDDRLARARMRIELLDRIEQSGVKGTGRSMLLTRWRKADLDPVLFELVSTGKIVLRDVPGFLPRRGGNSATGVVCYAARFAPEARANGVARARTEGLMP